MNNPELRDLVLGLAEGESRREVCPFCHGGRTRERSFQITREGGVAKYVCHRASCSSGGRRSYGGMSPTNSAPVRNPALDKYMGEYTQLTDKYREFLLGRFEITADLLHYYGVRQAADGRVLLPLLHYDGTRKGDSLRYYPELSPQSYRGSKSMIYRPLDEVPLAWYTLPAGSSLLLPDYRSDTLIIVEDQISAMKASRLVDSVALVGTNMSMPKLVEIGMRVAATPRYKRTLVLLDADATAQAARMVARVRSLLTNVSMRRLDCDIKDTPYAELPAVFN